MENQKKKIWRSVWFLIAVFLFICAGAYAIMTYGLPYLTWRSAGKIKASMDNLASQAMKCEKDDNACDGKNRLLRKEIERDIAQFSKLYAPMNETVRTKEVIEAMKHPDGTICYMVHAPIMEVTDDELRTWLDGFGAERFFNLFGNFLAAIEIYEEKYHLPTPSDAWLATFDRLKWHHFPFGKTWRMYNLTGRLAKWIVPAAPKGNMPDEILSEIMTQITQHGEYFTSDNSMRLYILAKKELGMDQKSSQDEQTK